MTAPVETVVVSTEPAKVDRPRVGGHIPVLDGIRGLAILLVIIHHVANSFHAEFGLNGLVVQGLRSGWVGVDLFFVLSGFLITGILFDAKDSPGYFRNFYARRALRVFPLYYAALVIAFVAARAWPGPESITGTGQYSFGLWLYLTNIFLAKGGWATYGWLGHFWSLAIEEHFYMVWPLLVFALSRRTLLRVSAAIVVGALLLRIWGYSAGLWPGAMYFLTPFRADSLAMGAFLALLARSGGLKPYVPHAWIAGGASLLGLLAIGVLFRRFDYDHWPVYTAGFSLLAAIFGAFLLLSVESTPRGVWNRSLTHPVLRFFGKYSYGLYVVHTPIFTAFLHSEPGRSLLKELGLWSPLGSGVVVVATTLGVALASWNLLEKPFLSLKRFFEYRPDKAAGGIQQRTEASAS